MGEQKSSGTRPRILFLCTGEGEHSHDSDVAFLRSSPAWDAVQELVEKLIFLNPLEAFFDQTLGEHGHPYSPLVSAAINILNADLWRSWGFAPDFTLGHSIGEVAATYIAGVLPLEEALRTAYLLGNAGSELDGAMLATVLPKGHALWSRQGRDFQSLCVAAVNYEEEQNGEEMMSVALSGPAAHIDSWLTHDEKAKRLRPERPWHHPAYDATPGCAMVTGKPSNCVARVDSSGKARCTFVSATTGTDLSQLDVTHWTQWLTRPVQFSAALQHTARLIHNAEGADMQQQQQQPGSAPSESPPTIITVELGCQPVLTTYASKSLTRDGVRVLAQAAAMRRGRGTADFIGRERSRLEALIWPSP